MYFQIFSFSSTWVHFKVTKGNPEVLQVHMNIYYNLYAINDSKNLDNVLKNIKNIENLL